MPPGIKMKITGNEKILVNLKKVPSRLGEALGGGLYLEASNIMTDSKKQSPVDLGTMKASGYITLPEITLSSVKVEMGYGGPSADYVVVQHEHTEFNHEVGKAKFLEDPMYAHRFRFSKKVTNYAKRLFDMNKGASKSSFPENPNINAAKKAIKKLKIGGWGG